MSDEFLLWGLLGLSFILLCIIYVQYLSKRKIQQELLLLEEQYDELLMKEEHKPKEVTSHFRNVDLENIKKIESLEKMLKDQKRRIHALKVIAQDANRVKSEFLANIRHEIRTPMNSIMVFAGLLKEENLNPKLQSYVKNILSSGNKLLNLLNEIIELSNSSQGAFVQNEKAVDIKEMLKHLLEEVREQVDKKGISLELNIDQNTPESVIIDEEKVSEILRNLLENAAKFTDHGKVRVNLIVKKIDIVNNRVDLTIVVEDTGIGMSSEQLDKIFKIFEQPMQDDDKVRGAGLRLSINKKIAHSLNGDLNVISSLGKGTTFTLILKGVEIVLSSAKQSSSEEELIDFSQIEAKYNKFVVVDTQKETVHFFEKIFENTPHKIISYENPRDLIAAVKKSDIDIIFIDIDILSADENALAKILMRLSEAVIVTLTKNQRIKELHFPQDIKIAGHLKKPVSVRELFKLTLSALNFKDNSSQEELVHSRDDNRIEYKPEDIKEFLADVSKNVDPLYIIADKTNDLGNIEKFAKRLQLSSSQNNIKSMKTFSDELVKKIALFDIEAIQRMMKEYQEKIQSLKNL